jgi:hypothetical protein
MSFSYYIPLFLVPFFFFFYCSGKGAIARLFDLVVFTVLPGLLEVLITAGVLLLTTKRWQVSVVAVVSVVVYVCLSQLLSFHFYMHIYVHVALFTKSCAGNFHASGCP